MRFTRSVRTPFDSVAWTAASAAGEISTRSPLTAGVRSEEHTSELQALRHLVCRLLLDKEEHCAQRTSYADRIGDAARTAERGFGLLRTVRCYARQSARESRRAI